MSEIMTKIKNRKLSGTGDLIQRFRWPVPVSIVIDQPPEKVWEIISKAGNLELCHPFCSKNPVQVWPGKNSRDEVHYLNGLIFERRFISWEEGKGSPPTVSPAQAVRLSRCLKT